MSMRKLVSALLLIAAAPALAQFSDTYDFLKAVRDKDGAKAKSLIDKPGTTTVDTKDSETGETALHIVVKRRDVPWIGFLLANGADPNARDRQGNTPLLLASGIGLTEGVQVLLTARAQVDLSNNLGETPLIRAVQARDVPTARQLLEAGADPDLADHAAGYSARDYAGQLKGPVAKLLADAPRRSRAAVMSGPH